LDFTGFAISKLFSSICLFYFKLNFKIINTGFLTGIFIMVAIPY
jgi:hypothetical protein